MTAKLVHLHMKYGWIQRGRRRSWPPPPPPPPLKNHKNIGFHSNTGPDPLKKHKATKPVFNVGPSSACQGNAILMGFHWQADDGPLIVVFGSSHPSSTKKKTKNIKVGYPSDKNFWIRPCEICFIQHWLASSDNISCFQFTLITGILQVNWIQIMNLCVPTLPKIFRPVTWNTLFCLHTPTKRSNAQQHLVEY